MAAAVERSTATARKTDRVGLVAIVHDQATLDRIQGVIRELQLDDELSFETTLDAGLALAAVLFPPLRAIFSIRLVRAMFRRGHLGRFHHHAAV